jgi:hypothetical protein
VRKAVTVTLPRPLGRFDPARDVRAPGSRPVDAAPSTIRLFTDIEAPDEVPAPPALPPAKRWYPVCDFFIEPIIFATGGSHWRLRCRIDGGVYDGAHLFKPLTADYRGGLWLSERLATLGLTVGKTGAPFASEEDFRIRAARLNDGAIDAYIYHYEHREQTFPTISKLRRRGAERR